LGLVIFLALTLGMVADRMRAGLRLAKCMGD